MMTMQSLSLEFRSENGTRRMDLLSNGLFTTFACNYNAIHKIYKRFRNGTQYLNNVGSNASMVH